MSVVHGLQHEKRTECARAYDPRTGNMILLSHVRYNMVHPATGSNEEFYVEQVNSDGTTVHASGWETEEQAMKHITSYPEEQPHIVFGKPVDRFGLGIPEGLVMRSAYSISSAEVRAEQERLAKKKEQDDAAARKKEVDEAVAAALANASQKQTDDAAARQKEINDAVAAALAAKQPSS